MNMENRKMAATPINEASTLPSAPLLASITSHIINPNSNKPLPIDKQKKEMALSVERI